MNRNLLARVLAALVLALLFAAYIHHDVQRTSREGREKFLARQDRRFDQTALMGRSAAGPVIGSLIVTIPFLLCYELAVLAISNGLKAVGIGIEPSTTPPIPSPGLPFS